MNLTWTIIIYIYIYIDRHLSHVQRGEGQMQENILKWDMSPPPNPRLNMNRVFPGMEIFIIKVRRSLDCLISIMGIYMLLSRHLYIDTVPMGLLQDTQICGLRMRRGMSGTFSPPPRVNNPAMHHGTCVTHVPWCMPGSLTGGFLWSRWWRKRSRHSRCMRNAQFYVSGKRPMKPLLRLLF